MLKSSQERLKACQFCKSILRINYCKGYLTPMYRDKKMSVSNRERALTLVGIGRNL